MKNPLKRIRRKRRLDKAKRYGKVAGTTAGAFFLASGPAFYVATSADPYIKFKNKKVQRGALIARAQIGTAIAGKAAYSAYKASAEKNLTRSERKAVARAFSAPKRIMTAAQKAALKKAQRASALARRKLKR
jgi:hypothetical protein